MYEVARTALLTLLTVLGVFRRALLSRVGACAGASFEADPSLRL